MAKKAMYTVCLPMREDGNDTVEIGINGVMYILKRGQEAQVDARVYEVLRGAGLLEDEAK